MMQFEQVVVTNNLSNDALNTLQISPTRRADTNNNNNRENFQWPSANHKDAGTSGDSKKNFQWSPIKNTTDNNKKNFQWSDVSSRVTTKTLDISRDTTPKPPSTRLPRAISTGGLRGLTLNQNRHPGSSSSNVPPQQQQQQQQQQELEGPKRQPVKRTLSGKEMTELRRHNSANSLRCLAMASTGRLRRRAPERSTPAVTTTELPAGTPEAPTKPKGKDSNKLLLSSSSSCHSTPLVVSRISSATSAAGEQGTTATDTTTVVALEERKVIRTPSSSGYLGSMSRAPNQNRGTTPNGVGRGTQTAADLPGSTAAVKAGIPGSVRIDHQQEERRRRRSSCGGGGNFNVSSSEGTAATAPREEGLSLASPEDHLTADRSASTMMDQTDPSASTMMDAGESSAEEEQQDDDVLLQTDDQQAAYRDDDDDSMSSIDEDVDSNIMDDATDDEEEDYSCSSSDDDSSSIALEDYNDMVTGLWSQESAPLKIRDVINSKKPPQEDVLVKKKKIPQQQPSSSVPAGGSSSAMVSHHQSQRQQKDGVMRWRKDDGTYITQATPAELQNALNEGIHKAAAQTAAAGAAAAAAAARQGINYQRSASAHTAATTTSTSTRSPPSQRGGYHLGGIRTDSGGNHSDVTTGTTAMPTTMMQITVVHQPTPKPWVCLCGEENDDDYKFCGMCATARFWVCWECRFERNKCRNICCGGCGARKPLSSPPTTRTPPSA